MTSWVLHKLEADFPPRRAILISLPFPSIISLLFCGSAPSSEKRERGRKRTVKIREMDHQQASVEGRFFWAQKNISTHLATIVSKYLHHITSPLKSQNEVWLHFRISFFKLKNSSCWRVLNLNCDHSAGRFDSPPPLFLINIALHTLAFVTPTG